MADVEITRVEAPEPIDPERIYDENGNWIGLRLIETITLDEFKKRYPSE